jgi:hypothetical protein
MFDPRAQSFHYGRSFPSITPEQSSSMNSPLSSIAHQFNTSGIEHDKQIDVQNCYNKSECSQLQYDSYQRQQHLLDPSEKYQYLIRRSLVQSIHHNNDSNQVQGN